MCYSFSSGHQADLKRQKSSHKDLVEWVVGGGCWSHVNCGEKSLHVGLLPTWHAGLVVPEGPEKGGFCIFGACCRVSCNGSALCLVGLSRNEQRTQLKMGARVKVASKKWMMKNHPLMNCMSNNSAIQAKAFWPCLRLKNHSSCVALPLQVQLQLVDPSTSYGISYRSQRSTFFAVCFSQDLTPLDQHSHDSPVDCIQEASKFQIQHKILVTEWWQTI